MRDFMIFLFVLFMNIPALVAQVNTDNQRFEHIDAHVSKINRKAVFHPQLLAELLATDLTNDYDKVRAFYVWIAKNIDYDLWAFTHDRNEGQGLNEVLRSGKALCTGYSLLFNYFCGEANIKSEIIEGYAKGMGYKENQKFNVSNHAWNAVNIYGQWYLLDVTWAAGNPFYLSRNEKKIDLTTWFLTAPEKFIRSHLPEDPTWQLLDKKVLLSEFEAEENRNVGNSNINNYSPADYIDLNEYDKDILMYKRAYQFNPKNTLLAEQLSFAYIYRGISLTDKLWQMDYRHLTDTAANLVETFDAYMDSARHIIGQINKYEIPSVKNKINEEINYQKGVINYEVGVELFLKAMQLNLPTKQFNNQTENYFQTAENYFDNVSTTSIYYKDAREYIAQIQEFRQRKNGQIILE